MYLEIGQKENQYTKQDALNWKADSAIFSFCSYILAFNSLSFWG